MAMSNPFATLDIDSITIAPDRERREGGEKRLGNIEALAASIERLGLINAIIVTRGRELRAGERRLTAYRLLRDRFDLLSPAGTVNPYQKIPYRYFEDLDEADSLLVELDENNKREDFHWKDKARGIARYHRMKVESELNWSLEKTGEQLNEAISFISKCIAIADELAAGNERVAAAESIASAYNVINREDQRKKQDQLNDLLTGNIDIVDFVNGGNTNADKPHTDSGAEDASGTAQNSTAPDGVNPSDNRATDDPAKGPNGLNPPIQRTQTGTPTPQGTLAPSASETILNTPFAAFAESYTGKPFHFIHCDFPYGINHQDSDQGKVARWGEYDDSPDVYWSLCRQLMHYSDKLIYPCAHMMFWLTQGFKNETIELFAKHGFTQADEYDLAWIKSDNKGIASDVSRRPRRIYETAVMFVRGDRRIVRCVSNAISHPKGQSHVSEKPYPVLQHFFRMFVENGTRVLDPTCGSGTSIRAAESLGGFAMGCELNADKAEEARRQLTTARALGYKQGDTIEGTE